ncbi:hypothetical protein Asphe3_10540 [Pseudarthrobacter phenanthrenivorans Sphe3]|uniref:ARB-07466-like C-terminal domain-containing protein n=1 Tax=Pseudarthrobacter phenanthrenivorans (strain DSM 18606 / JCM 16027 / LMG 23796 / Sphe3) TaxID=930171 RepID=F0M3L9_PSEPM|nr:hypothetical protein [Pseudarthrobacter phenanthrenivorans]ADX72238.1 hypothetical protein Asphe3_10540 [Pseudarthrobacter phenanthrenivorans Sphe3]
MTGNQTLGSRHRARRLFLGLILFGALASVLVLLGPGLLSGLRTADGSLVLRPECVVETPDGEVGLDRDAAKRATTAVALLARGMAAPDTTGIDQAVLQRLVDGPSGDAGPVLSCRGSAARDLQEQQAGASGLTPRAERLRTAMAEVFGGQSLGGFAPGGVDQGHGADSTHYDGRAIDIFFRPVTEENRRQGWILAHWLVAHAGDLNVQYVIFDDRFWSARSSRGQWGDYDAPEPGNEILRHLDHVHVDVLGGSPS